MSIDQPTKNVNNGVTINYTDPNSGLNLPEAFFYSKVQWNLTDQQVRLEFDIYTNVDYFLSGMDPAIRQKVYVCDITDPNDNYNTYFSTEVMNQPNCSIVLQSLVYIQFILK